MAYQKASSLVIAFCSALCLGWPASRCLARSTAETRYRGMAEASAAAMLDEEHFVVAEDECNTLLVYALGSPNQVGKRIDLAEFLATGDKAPDIEGGARVGDLIYWISSHSLPKSGKSREWRERFFATNIDTTASPRTVRSHGKAYAHLLEDMISAPQLAELRLADAAAILPEKDDGLNIEGLAAWKGDGLLIGFRGPLRAGKAPVVPFTNPASVVQGAGRAKFEKPILLDLGGRGIRSIDRVDDHYLIVAGPVADVGTFAIYRWSGSATDAPVLKVELKPGTHAPEALLATPSPREVILLSDDGSSQPGAACGSTGKAQQQFRALRVRLP